MKREAPAAGHRRTWNSACAMPTGGGGRWEIDGGMAWKLRRSNRNMLEMDKLWIFLFFFLEIFLEPLY